MISNNVSLGSPYANTIPSRPQIPENQPVERADGGNLETRIIERGGEAAKNNASNPNSVNPEAVNSFAGNAQNTVDTRQANEQAQQDATRAQAVNIVEAQSQQKAAEAYVNAYSEEAALNDDSVSLQTLADITRYQNNQNRLDDIQSASELANNIRESSPQDDLVRIQNQNLEQNRVSEPAQRLSSSIENAVGAGRQTSSFNIQV